MSSTSSKTQLCAIDKTPPNDQVAIATLKDLFEKKNSELSKIAAKHLTPDRLAKIAVNCVSKTPRLLECTPISILASVMAGAAMGLEAGGPLGHGFLVPRFNGRKKVMECTFLPGYRGLIDLARRSGHVLSIEADVVYEADLWNYSKTEMGTTFTHIPNERDEPGAVLRAYAVARLKDSPVPVVVVMSRREIDAIRDREKKSADSPWDSDFSEMAKKSAIRRICKYLPMSIEMANCLDREADDETREVIDVTPRERLRSVTAGPEISEPHVDRSDSQEQPNIENLGEVLRAIDGLRSGDECAVHSERLKAARWASDEDRSSASAALKARWKAVLDEAKAAMKAATKTSTPAAAASAQEQVASPGAALKNCEECGALPNRAHHTVCPNREGAPDLEGDEIQGRSREPGEEG